MLANKIIILNRRDKASLNDAQRNGYRSFICDRTTPLGNPYHMYDELERNRVCDDYDKYFHAVMVGENRGVQRAYHRILSALRAGEKVSLVCWCSPKRCHAETIRDALVRDMAVLNADWSITCQ